VLALIPTLAHAGRLDQQADVLRAALEGSHMTDDELTLVVAMGLLLAAVYRWASSPDDGGAIAPAVDEGAVLPPPAPPTAPAPSDGGAPGAATPAPPTRTAGGADAFDLRSAQLVNAPDVRDWPVTAQITRVTFTGNNTVIDFDRKDGANRWPDQAWGAPGDSLQYTIWLFLQQGGAWVGSAFIQMWYGRDGAGDAPSDYAANWYYSSRWAPMDAHGPIAGGESIAFMVTPGNARDNGGPLALAERSNIVIVPATDNGSFET